MSARPEIRLRGLRSREKGRAFEELLDLGFALAYRRGLALVQKTPEPMKVLRPLGNGRFECCFAHAAQPDYKGVLKGGRAVFFEAKYTDTGCLRQSAVTVEQAAILDAAESLGALCYVLCGFRDAVYRVPWRVWRDMESAIGRRYVTPEDLAPYRVSVSALIPAGEEEPHA